MTEEKQPRIIICTCLDMCGWQPCPYAGREKPEGCPYREVAEK
jgi:hypothetical protein